MLLMQSKSLCEFIWLLYFIKIKDEVPASHETDFSFHYFNSIYICQSWPTFQNMSFLSTELIQLPYIHLVPRNIESDRSFLGAI